MNIPTISEAITHVTLRLYGHHLGGHVYRIPIHHIWVGMAVLTGWDYHVERNKRNNKVKSLLLSAEIPSDKLSSSLLDMSDSELALLAENVGSKLEGRVLDAPERMIVLEIVRRTKRQIDIPL